MLSKFAGGLGNDWTNVRALGSHIKGTNGKSQGVVPFLKVVNDTAVAVNQGGKRKGAVCAYASWVKHCNAGFCPTTEEAAYYVKVIDVFAEGIKRGMASVPIDGKMIDVPVDLRAKLYLKWAHRVKARDEAKARAHQ